MARPQSVLCSEVLLYIIWTFDFIACSDVFARLIVPDASSCMMPLEEPLKPQWKGPWIVCAWGVPELVSLQPCWTLSCTWATEGGLVLSKVYFNSQLTLSRYGDCVLAALSSLSWTQHIYLLQHCFSDWYVAALSAIIKISLPDICHYCAYTTIQAIWLCTEIAEDVVYL